MDRWKAELGRGREKRRVEESRSEKRKSQKKEDADARKGRKVAKHCVFPMICGSRGSKSRLAKAAGAEPSGQMRDEKLHAVVARSTFQSQNVRVAKHTRSGPRLEVEMSKKCTPLWREAHFEIKMHKAHQCRTTFGSWDVEKVHAVVARSTFRSQNVQNATCSRHFWRFRCRFAWQARGIVHLVKSEQNVRVFVAFPKTMAGGTFEEDLQRCIFCGRRSAKDMFMRDVRRAGRWFPERGCILEHQICRFAKMIWRDRCSTSYDLASIFRGRRSTLDRWSGKIAKRIGTRLSAPHLTFHFWRKSRRIALFLMLSSSEIEDVSQNCFVLDVVKFKNCRRLVKIFCFWCCQRRKMRKSRRIA